jgi:2-polyprenyl-6-methoxyphenol hydroxylase-like FAD-dependent oxidoreductase
LSRFVMDATLAARFRELGGELSERDRAREAVFGEGVVRATGRCCVAAEHGWRWFGLKVHARGVAMFADLEMHGQPEGYVGLCRLSGDIVNICGLFRKRPAAGELAQGPQELLRGAAGTPLRERLAEAEFDEESFCAVAGLPLRPRHAVGRGECCLGDALTMIPPVTGNGMSMAFEAVELALDPLVTWSQGEIAWNKACEMAAQACDRAFAQRLAWARCLQWLMFSPAFRRSPGRVALNSEMVWRGLFARTR